MWRVAAERIRAPNSSSGVSDRRGVGSVLTLVSLSKTLNHYCFILRMGRKAVGLVCCVMHVEEPSYTYRKEKGFAPVILAVAAECAAAPCKSVQGATYMSVIIH